MACLVTGRYLTAEQSAAEAKEPLAPANLITTMPPGPAAKPESSLLERLNEQTLGGVLLWGDELFFHDWRIQRHVITGHCRLLDGDTGQSARQTIRARHTCTFVAPKRGFAASGAADYLGEVHVLSIGAPRCLIEAVLRQTQP